MVLEPLARDMAPLAPLDPPTCGGCHLKGTDAHGFECCESHLSCSGGPWFSIGLEAQRYRRWCCRNRRSDVSNRLGSYFALVSI